MKHISKIDKKTYYISESISYDDHKHDDITLIWDFEPFDKPALLVGWFYGEYDYEQTEEYIRKFISSLSHDKKI
jgi:hypothetical protein